MDVLDWLSARLDADDTELRIAKAAVQEDARRSRQRHIRMRTTKVGEVDVVRVLARDGWRCQICGISTPANLRGTRMLNAPQGDHIVPLSKGGEHSEANMQCACLACNRLKGAKLPIPANDNTFAKARDAARRGYA